MVDPSIYVDEYLSLGKSEGFRIRHVIDTHQHADHISGARPLANEAGAMLHLNPLDSYRYRDFASMTDGEMIELAGEDEIKAIHTPGHTKGSTSLLIQNTTLLAGDILFLEGLARPDLHDRADEFAHDLYNTYQSKILTLPSNTDILPAHFSRAVRIEFGKPFHSTLRELRSRISMLDESEDLFTRYVLEHIPPTPPNYEAILSINRGEFSYDSVDFEELEEGPNRCALRA